jgi:hypothetical protein
MAVIVVVKKRSGNPTMGGLLFKLGTLRDVQGVQNTEATNAIVLDFPQPPIDKYWIVDSASVLFENSVANSVPDVVLSGLFLVPNNQKAVQDPANTGVTAADLVNRGVALPVDLNFEVGGATWVYWGVSLVRPVIVPYGYILRAVMVPYNLVAFVPAGLSFTSRAMIRELPLSDCEPTPVCVV